MGFGQTPLDGSSIPIPMSSAVPDGSNQPYAVEGGPTVSTDGNTLVPVSVYIKDGNDVALGTSTDAANANSVVGQLKQIKANTASVVLAASSAVIGVVAFGGTTTLGVPSNNGVTVVKSSSGRLASVIVTTTGAAQMNIYDNASQASGTIIGAIPADAAVGSVYQFNSPAQNGIVANAVPSCCAVTICYY